MTQIQVKSADIIKLILQFLKENSTSFDYPDLHQSFRALQKESKISINCTNTAKFISDIMESKWDEVLIALNSLMPNQEYFIFLCRHLFNLYELIIDDLIEADRFEAANYILKQFLSKNIKNLSNFKQKIMRIEYIIQNPDQKVLHKKIVNQTRKRQIIRQFLQDIHEDVEESRLVKLLAQSIKFQAHQGTLKPNIKLSLFEGKQKINQIEQETIIKSIEKVVQYSEDSKINCMSLSWSDEYLALGGVDGLIEIYNTYDYTLHSGLKFQEENVMLFHENPVSIMEFNYSDQILVSGDTKGIVKIWNLENGKLLRKLQSQTLVSTICWGMEASHLLLGYTDIKLYGIKSLQPLKYYQSPESNEFLSKIMVSQNRLFAISTSGSIKIFNYTSQERLTVINLNHSVINVNPLYKAKGSHVIDKFIVGTAKKLFEFNTNGEEKYFSVQNGELLNCCCVGDYLYEFIKGDDKIYRMSVYSRSTGKNLYFCGVESQVNLVCMLKQRNLMITYNDKHSLNFWRQMQ